MTEGLTIEELSLLLALIDKCLLNRNISNRPKYHSDLQKAKDLFEVAKTLEDYLELVGKYE